MGKKQKVKAITKTKVKKTATKKVAVKLATKKTLVKSAVKKNSAKTANKKLPAPKKAVKVEKKIKPSVKPPLAKKINTPLKNTAIQKPQAKVVAPPVTAIKKAKPGVKPTPPASVAPEKKIIKKAITPAKKREIHPNQYTIEYPIHASASLLFEIISSPSGLSEWFADNVNIRDGNFTFFWDGSQQTAKMVAYKEEKMVRFRWTDKPEYTFFEFKIETDELTNDTSLIITDFAEDGDKESAKLLWDNQINGLKHAIGS